jgi:predicted DNA-binding transcriptional regulator YafY
VSTSRKARASALWGLVGYTAAFITEVLVGRSAEMIRQWEILRTLESARLGKTIQELADDRGVTTRTIRRDLSALEQAGFPLESTEGAGAHRWKLTRPVTPDLHQTFTFAELSALYFSRTLIECLAGTPFHGDLKNAFDKLQGALSPKMRQFFDRLPAVIGAKTEPNVKLRDKETQALVARLLQATFDQRRVKMSYHSFKSRKVKEYIVEPYRLVYAQGGLYLIASVPKYQQQRTFAVERIKKLTPLDERFIAPEGAAEHVFSNSLGVNVGEPTLIEIEFSPVIAPYLGERCWHKSQKIRSRADGSIVMTLEVCDDQALRSWVMGFGSGARVLAPEKLARSLFEEMDRARTIYAERFGFGPVDAGPDAEEQGHLPLRR